LDILIKVLTVLLALDCLLLLALILVQRGRGGGLAGAFGGLGGGGESAFGTRAVSTAKKATAVLAALFILLSATLYMVQGRRGAAGEPSPGGDTGDTRPVEPRNK